MRSEFSAKENRYLLIFLTDFQLRIRDALDFLDLLGLLRSVTAQGRVERPPDRVELCTGPAECHSAIEGDGCGREHHLVAEVEGVLSTSVAKQESRRSTVGRLKWAWYDKDYS